jgi:hypothetical protein
MISCEVIIAESISSASFGRRNYFGVNHGRRILVPAFPYRLEATFIVSLRVPADAELRDLHLEMTSEWGFAARYDLGVLRSSELPTCRVIEWRGLGVEIPAPGTLGLTVSMVGCHCDTSWQVEQGQGPLRAATTVLPVTSVIDGRKPWTHMTDLASEVRSSLTIADQYASPAFLENLFPAMGRRPACRVIVSPRQARNHAASWTAVVSAWSGLAVRSSRLIHDRFVVRDDEEVYAFGHSLDALESGRISFFSRVYDLDQANAIRHLVEDAWARGSPVT